MNEPKMIRIRVRVRIEGGGREDREFAVPMPEEMVVLNALEYIRAEVDPSLTYKSSCRRGVCGACRMLINGTVRLACETPVEDGMHIDPFVETESQ